jgi:glucose dehydrogenase
LALQPAGGDHARECRADEADLDESTGGNFGGLEATPLYRDGVLYFSADYGRIFAVDACTTTVLWHYEPSYDPSLPRFSAAVPFIAASL